MHFQYHPFSEIKIIRCLKGRVFDVIVDARKGSSTFLKWQSIELSPESDNMIYIPEGFAHGFQTLEPDSELLYFHSNFYHPSSEGGLRFDDPAINIAWPLPAVNMSPKDMNYPLLQPSFGGVSS
jgi:dTDP-4-dehydrorhamnose 3,5-epimerase